MITKLKWAAGLFLAWMIVVCGSVTAFADMSCTDWCDVTIKQKEAGHKSGCTVVSLQLILQNSGVLKPEYQLSGQIAGKTPEYAAFDNVCKFKAGDSWKLDEFASAASSLCSSDWSNVSGEEHAIEVPYGSVTAIIGLGEKTFENMTDAEVLTALKTFWNAGYYIVFGVKYGNERADANGASGHKAAHVAMLAGVDDTTIYLNDPAKGTIQSYTESSGKGGRYRLVYLVCFKNETSSPSKDTLAPITEQDLINAEGLGISGNFFICEEELEAQIQ